MSINSLAAFPEIYILPRQVGVLDKLMKFAKINGLQGSHQLALLLVLYRLIYEKDTVKP
jgi:hypothetical protein